MLGAQLSGRTSLREVELLFALHPTRHYHLNCSAVKRSTLADANRKRDHAAFRDIAAHLIASGGRRERTAKAVLSVLDSSPVRLVGRGHEWAEPSRAMNDTQGLKLHLLLTPEDGGLDYLSITDMNVNDITDAMNMPLEEGRIYLFDKGYCDYNWWHEIIGAGSHFVTRLKSKAAHKIIEERPASEDGIISDRIIELTNRAPRAGKTNHLAGHPLRLVEIAHPAGKRTPFVIVSDMLEVPASEIAALYKRRWDIELLFKWIKQNLKIKRFMGESRNAIMIQIYTAIIAYLLIRAYRKLIRTSTALRLKDLVQICQTNLFQPLHINPSTPQPAASNQHEMSLQLARANSSGQ